MPHYIIACSTTYNYWLAVNAPSKEAAEKFYDLHSDGVEFHAGSEEGWELNDIYEQSPQNKPSADLVLNEKGEIVQKNYPKPLP